jgi:carbamoyl-phosphate synthase large subunit
MAPRHFKELQCWQLADELRREVIAICSTPPASKHLTFCDSFQDAAGSVCHNISEGFKRFSSPEIVRFFRYAVSSLAEVQDHLQECLSRRFVSKETFDRLWELSEHTNAKTLNFMRPHVERIERERRERANPRKRARPRSA